MSDFLGKPPQADQGRDAIHVPIIPLVAGEKLKPGQHIALSTKDSGVAFSVGNKIGIVDPFLTNEVPKDEKFWCCLYPGSIKSIAHYWTHPNFDSNQASIDYISAFAESVGQDYDSLMAAAHDWVINGSYTYDNSETYKDIPYEMWNGFWFHYEKITGLNINNDDKTSFFTCSC